MTRWMFLIALLAACNGGHVTLPTLPTTMSPRERVEAYIKLRPTGTGVTQVTSCHGGACSTTTMRSLLIGDDVEIKHAEDVRGVVAPSSEAGRRLVDYDRARKRGTWFFRAGLATFLGGLATAVVASKLHYPAAQSPALIVMVVGPFISLGGYIINARSVRSANEAVFAAYDDGLAQRLNVCVEGLNVKPCEGGDAVEIPDPTIEALPQR